MTKRANLVGHISIHNCFEKATQSIETFLKNIYTLAEKLVTAAVIMVITGLVIFALYLGLIQFAFLILS